MIRQVRSVQREKNANSVCNRKFKKIKINHVLGKNQGAISEHCKGQDTRAAQTHKNDSCKYTLCTRFATEVSVRTFYIYCYFFRSGTVQKLIQTERPHLLYHSHSLVLLRTYTILNATLTCFWLFFIPGSNSLAARR